MTPDAEPGPVQTPSSPADPGTPSPGGTGPNGRGLLSSGLHGSRGDADGT
jgi:hypothetical protein